MDIYEPYTFIEAKAVMMSEVFDSLPLLLQGCAFTINGVRCIQTLHRVRDRIADLPRGHDWDAVQKDVLAEITPWLVTSDDPEVRAQELVAAKRRAELLLRVHGFQAYSAAKYRELMESVDVFPYWKYLSMDDGLVRHTHAALNGKIIPGDSPFWKFHWPPWELGCRCTVVAMLPDEVDEIAAGEAMLSPNERSILNAEQLLRLEEYNEILDDKGSTCNLRLPSNYRFAPSLIFAPLAKLKEHVDVADWSHFLMMAHRTHVSELDNRSLWEWVCSLEHT